MVETVRIDDLNEITPVIGHIAKRMCPYMADDLTQEALADLVEMVQNKGSVSSGYAITSAARSMWDYFIANRTPVYIPSRTMRDKEVKEYTKMLAELWMGADHV